MFALEIILHLLDFAFGFCCCFIYISALSNTLLHVIEQVRNISIEEKHREGREGLLKIVITLLSILPGSDQAQLVAKKNTKLTVTGTGVLWWW